MFDLPQPVMEIEGVDYFAGGRRILASCELQLYPSEVLAIAGRSGSGKTSFLDILSGRAEPSSCTSFRLKGHDFLKQEGPSKVGLRRAVTGYVAQDASTILDLNLSAGANIARRLFDLGLDNAHNALQTTKKLTDQFGLPAERLTEPVRNFSGGMRQRVQIAAAMIHRPDILFLDEPTTGLDTVAQAQLLEILKQIRNENGTAMILITHDLRMARLIADRVLIMDAGQIVGQAVTDRLITEPTHPVAKAMVGAII